MFWLSSALRLIRALSLQVARQLVSAAQKLDEDPAVRVMIVTGEGNKAFAAGADVRELADQSYSSVRWCKNKWDRILWQLSAIFLPSWVLKQ